MTREIPLPRRRDATAHIVTFWSAKRAEARREGRLVLDANGDWIAL